MIKRTRSALAILSIIFAAAAACSGHAHAEIATDQIFILTPNHDAATFDFYSYSPADSIRDVKYFLVLFGGLQSAITNLSVKVSSSPVFKSYEGSVTYSLLALGYPNVFAAKITTATNSTVASNYIKADFPVNSQYGVALIGVALLERHNTVSDVKMSLKVSVQY